MRKLLPVVLLWAMAAFAEESWMKKSYLEWTEKDIKKVLSASPWAREVALSIPGGGGAPGGGGGGGRKGGGGGGGGIAGADAEIGGMGGGAGGGGGGGRKGGGGGGGGMEGGAPPSIPAKIYWQTAMPIKQALLKRKFGDGVETNPQAKQMLAQQETVYVVVVEGLPGRMAQMGKRLRDGLMQSAALKRKDKAPITPTDVQIGAADGKTVVIVVFPRTDVIVAEDKEVEFVSKIGPMDVKRKFKLSEMMYQGKLEL